MEQIAREKIFLLLTPFKMSFICTVDDIHVSVSPIVNMTTWNQYILNIVLYLCSLLIGLYYLETDSDINNDNK